MGDEPWRAQGYGFSTVWKTFSRFFHSVEKTARVAALLAEPHALAAEARCYRPRVRPAPGRLGLGTRLFSIQWKNISSVFHTMEKNVSTVWKNLEPRFPAWGAADAASARRARRGRGSEGRGRKQPPGRRPGLQQQPRDGGVPASKAEQPGALGEAALPFDPVNPVNPV